MTSKSFGLRGRIFVIVAAVVVDFFGLVWPLLFGVLVVVVKGAEEFWSVGVGSSETLGCPIPFFFSNPSSSSEKKSTFVLFMEGSVSDCSFFVAVLFVAPFFVPFLVIVDVDNDGDFPICVKTMSAAPSPKPPIVAASATTVGVERGGGGGDEATDPFLTPVRIRAFSSTALTRRRT
jgi:hypothetical protein